MGDDIGFDGVSAAPKAGVGLIIGDGGYTGSFPGGETELIGGEVVFDLRKGELALLYYHGSSGDSFSQDDLPVPQSFRDLFQFDSRRKASLHFGLAEWRWKEDPFYQTGKWTFIHPEVGFGAGAFHISTDVIGETTTHLSALKLVATGSISINLVEYGPLSLNTGVRMFAGQAFGMVAESGLRVEF